MAAQYVKKKLESSPYVIIVWTNFRMKKDLFLFKILKRFCSGSISVGNIFPNGIQLLS